MMLATLNSYGQQDKVERKIVKAIDLRTDASVELLKKSVNNNSGTMNFEGVRKVAQLFQSELDKFGFNT